MSSASLVLAMSVAGLVSLFAVLLITRRIDRTIVEHMAYLYTQVVLEEKEIYWDDLEKLYTETARTLTGYEASLTYAEAEEILSIAKRHLRRCYVAEEGMVSRLVKITERSLVREPEMRDPGGSLVAYVLILLLWVVLSFIGEGSRMSLKDRLIGTLFFALVILALQILGSFMRLLHAFFFLSFSAGLLSASLTVFGVRELVTRPPWWSIVMYVFLVIGYLICAGWHWYILSSTIKRAVLDRKGNL